MQEISFGQLLETIRKQQNISKTNLVRGLCSVSTLSRYENDAFLPDKFLADYLLERLGIDPALIDFVISEKNYKIISLRKNIKNAQLLKDWKMMSSLLEEYQYIKTNVAANIHEQYILLNQSNLLLHRDADYINAKEICCRALQLTKCTFAFSKNLGNTLLSVIEIELYINLFYIAYKQNDQNFFFYIYDLEKYLLKLGKNNEISAKYLPTIYYYIALIQKQNFELKQCRDCLIKAKEILFTNYSTKYLLEILTLQLELESIMHISSDHEIIIMQQMVIALKMLETKQNNYLLSEEGIQLWENTANQILF